MQGEKDATAASDIGLRLLHLLMLLLRPKTMPLLGRPTPGEEKTTAAADATSKWSLLLTEPNLTELNLTMLAIRARLLCFLISVYLDCISFFPPCI